MKHGTRRPVGIAPPTRHQRPTPASPVPRLAPLLVLCLLWAVAAAAAIAQDHVTEITVIRGGSSAIAPPAGYTKIGVDLNQGAGGDFIYLCYKRGIGAPVTGLAVTLNSASPPAGSGFARIDVDLNAGAGGDFIWLWVSRDPACTAIHGLNVQANTSAPPTGYTRIDVDLNRGAGGAFVYLSYLGL